MKIDGPLGQAALRGTALRAASPSAHADTRRRLLEKLSQRLIQRLAAEIEADDGPLGIDEVGRGDRADAEGVHQVGGPAGVMDLPPGEPAGLDEIDNGLLGLVQA